ncbi:HD domain-containing protein [Streptomyces viridochromogenes]|uniref:wHTH domain-containing protein n=1 Tax=Streptomyces viridochromogenes TaxID=1938 RepID=UPI00069FA3C6|nr:trypsin-like peptidase domain-containing protein [Streptomyces viridochromogenes]
MKEHFTGSAEWHARIEYGGKVAGAGFLIAPDTVLTCAHVAQYAEEAGLAVTFVACRDRPTVQARVVHHGGWAGHPTDPGDLVVLKLERDVPVRPAALAPVGVAYGARPRKLVVYGFPAGYNEGTLAECRITARQLISEEWVQLEAWQQGGQPLARGFSGAAVALEDTGEVVGMVTAASGARDVRNGRMMPTEVMTRHWPDLELLTRTANTSAAASPSASVPVSRTVENWRATVSGSPVWDLVKPAHPDRPAGLKEQAGEVVARLAGFYDTARGGISDDPWHDENLAPRIAHRTNHLIRVLWPDSEPRLASAEAALLALLPFLYQAYRTSNAAELATDVDPARLDELDELTPAASLRRKYEVLLRGHGRLVRQAKRGHLHGDPDGEREVGWWLFHQWANQQAGNLDRLLAAVCPEGSDIRRVLDPELVTRLVTCVQVPPQELFDVTREGHLRAEEFQLNLRGLEYPKVRERLTGSLFAIAHRMAIEVTDLPSVVVEHVGIPYALSPGRVLRTLEEEKASWSDQRDALRLKATCDHPAIVDALTEHTRRLELLLRHVRHADIPGLGTLPAYASASDLRSPDGNGTPGPVNGVIRFRLDEARVQELLMGENLYRDRSLAIRELYQNALDACRYRHARTKADDPHTGYQGRIEFTQGVEEGRHFLECRDNGIGMDETILSQAFSQAGVRFTDLPDFKDEQQEWDRRGIRMHPTSRFGIGVLSYFMLADEIRVTTRRMDTRRELTVIITGPGHYFQVRSSDEPRRGPGTSVRLYLRDGDTAPSCVRELRRLLGIAEFDTVAEHGSQKETWQANVLRPREAPRLRPDGFDAHGALLSWSDDSGRLDGQVVWCEGGGGILVDGIHVEPRERRGVLTDPDNRRQLRGVVVNLSGRSLPRRLSTDRAEILDEDVSDKVERLIRASLPALVTSRVVRRGKEEPWLTAKWLAEVAGRSPGLADIVTDAAGEHGCELELHGQPSPVARAGFFPQDVHIVHRDHSGLSETEASLGETLAGKVYSDPDDVTLLWRLLGQRPNAELEALAEIVPDLNRVEGVLAARPSDVLIRTAYFQNWDYRLWPDDEYGREQLGTPGHSLFVATVCGTSYTDVVARLRQLRLPAPAPYGAEPVADSINLALLSDDLHGLNRDEDPLTWLTTDEPVPPGHLLKAHHALGISVSEAACRMKTFGFEVPEDACLLDTQDKETLRLLSRNLNGDWPWLTPAEPVAIGQVLAAAAELGWPVPEVTSRLRSHGLEVNLDPAHEPRADDLLSQGAQWGWNIRDLTGMTEETVPPGAVADVAVQHDVPLAEISRRIAAVGLTPPPALPDRADSSDLVFLRVDADEDSPWLSAGAEVPLLHVAHASGVTGLPPAAVASRLRAYGLVPPDAPFPESLGPDDVTLVRRERDGSSMRSSYTPGERVPTHRVITVSVELRMPLRDVIDRLAQYGLGTSYEPLPTAPDELDPALVLLGPEHNRSTRRWLDWNEPVPPHHLISAPARLEIEPDEVAEALSALGFRIPEYRADEWDEVDRRLCVESHSKDSETIRLPLGLGQPISDFLLIARYADLPVDELVRRLTRLGVDLQRVVDAVHAALPHVPGLEWEGGSP